MPYQSRCVQSVLISEITTDPYAQNKGFSSMHSEVLDHGNQKVFPSSTYLTFVSQALEHPCREGTAKSTTRSLQRRRGSYILIDVEHSTSANSSMA